MSVILLAAIERCFRFSSIIVGRYRLAPVRAADLTLRSLEAFSALRFQTARRHSARRRVTCNRMRSTIRMSVLGTLASWLFMLRICLRFMRGHACR